MMNYFKSFLLFLMIFFTFILTGCQSLPKKVEVEPVRFESEKEVQTTEVRLSSGDVLEIRFFYTPEINTVQTIRPDGKISLQLIGEVMAQGKTPQELQEDLYMHYTEHFKQLDITVIVQSLCNRRIYVGGQIPVPGSVLMPGKMTALEAVMLAGGINLESGNYRNVLIIRYQNGKWTGGKLNLGKILNGKDTQPYYLKPLDIVYIPETKIYTVNRWINQHINGILPSVGFTYTINPDAANNLGITTNITPIGAE